MLIFLVPWRSTLLSFAVRSWKYFIWLTLPLSPPFHLFLARPSSSFSLSVGNPRTSILLPAPLIFFFHCQGKCLKFDPLPNNDALHFPSPLLLPYGSQRIHRDFCIFRRYFFLPLPFEVPFFTKARSKRKGFFGRSVDC